MTEESRNIWNRTEKKRKKVFSNSTESQHLDFLTRLLLAIPISKLNQVTLFQLNGSHGYMVQLPKSTFLNLKYLKLLISFSSDSASYKMVGVKAKFLL